MNADNQSNEILIYSDLTYGIIGSCFEVHNEKGNGYLEAVYQECLEIELASKGIPFEAQKPLRLTYKGKPLQQHYIVDFLINEKIILEIKAVKTLNDEHRAQVINYLKSTGMELGLLINFGSFGRIQHERFINQIKTSAPIRGIRS